MPRHSYLWAGPVAGYGERDLEAPLGGSMPGYFTDRKATGTIDPLMAKALYLRAGDVQGAIVSLDLIGLGAAEVAACRAEVSRRTGIPAAHVWIHATHTHTGTMVPRQFTSDAEKILGKNLYQGEVDPAWLAAFPGRVADAVEAARAAAKPGPARMAETAVEKVAFIRRFKMKDGTVRTNPGKKNPDVVEPAGHVDPTLTVLGFPEGRCLLAIYGVHPDTVGGTRYSADYPAELARTVRKELGADWGVVFLNAACGNINHVDVSDPDQGKGIDEANRIGRALGTAAVAAWGGAKEVEFDTLAFASRVVPTRYRTVPEAEVIAAEKVLAESPDAAMPFNGLQAPAAKILGRTADREMKAEIMAARLGPLGLAGMPGEIFVELAREVQHDSPFEPTRVIGLSNGSMGYIPDAASFPLGGYETGYRSARFEPNTGHRWAQAAVELLRRVAMGGRA